MPLLHKQKFIKKQIPSNLDQNQEIFYCKLTQEIFLDYDEYFERTILCNSLVWTCSLTGKSGLTYSEALLSEENARKSLKTFPTILERIIVYLATLTKRGNIKDLLDDVFTYVKDRYFIGEILNAAVGQANSSRSESRKQCKIIDVVPPNDSDDESENDSIDTDEDNDDEKYKSKNNFGIKAHKYKYLIEIQNQNGQSNRMIVKAFNISRPKGLLTKDKVQIILKMTCEAVNNIWVVKEIEKEKYSLNTIKFEQVFKGEPPIFDISFGRGKFSKLNQLNSNKSLLNQQNDEKINSYNKNNQINNVKSSTIKKSSATAKLSSKIKKKYSKQKSTNDDIKRNINNKKLLNDVDSRLSKKTNDAKKLMNRKILTMTDDDFKLWHEHVSDDFLDDLFDIEIEFEKLKRKEERDKEKERLKEEKRLEKELKKPREDLECDNLTELPEGTPIKTIIPQHLFGDALMILEFLNCFGDLFDINIDFPNGFNIELLEDALYSKSCESALCNLLIFYLDWIFKCYEEENFNDLNTNSDDDTNEIVNDSDEEEIHIEKLYNEPLKSINNNNDRSSFIKLADKYSKLIRNSQGRSLRIIGLDVFTISEMLRLYFLTSGSLHNHKIKFWYQQRGGYTNLDDIGIDFSIYETNIVKKLETINVFELEAEDKIKILLNLNHQLVTHVRFRDFLDDNFQKLSTLKAQLRDLQTEENRRLKEEASERWKRKLEDKVKQKTRLEEIKTNIVGKSTNKITKNSEELKLKRLEYESTRKREEFLKKEKQILNEINETQIKYSLTPLGKDRFYRRYWIYKSIPGLFIEDDDQFIEQLININSKQNYIEESNKENNNHFLTCSYYNSIDSKYQTINFKKGETKWRFYYKLEDIDKLINSLNERGFRESELKQNLIENRIKIIEKINKCPHAYLSMKFNDLVKYSSDVYNINQINDNINNIASEYLESNFRDKLLDIEEQIYNGVLGLLQVNDRLKWKNAIEKGSFDPQCSTLTYADNITIHLNTSKYNDTNAQLKIIIDLARALLQVEQSIERRFLQAPLGIHEKRRAKSKKINKTIDNDEDDNDSRSTIDLSNLQILMNWEKSLINCTSLSQLFVHFQTLDQSIIWSKSALNARCKICRKKGDADKMLLCDKCDRGHHTYCLRPILKTIPDGEWFCPDCRPKIIEKPVRQMRKSFSEQENDLYSNEDDNSEKRFDIVNDDQTTINNSDQEINIDDTSNDDYYSKRKTRKRKLDSDIISPIKLRNKTTKQITTASITSNDSNHSINSKIKINNIHQNGVINDGSECQTEDEINSYDEIPIKNSRKAKDDSKFDLFLNSTSSRNSLMTQRLKLTEKLVADLMKHQDAWPFLKPVTKREAPDYFDVIKKPMDFASIKNKINNFKYSDYSKILDDIRLIFLNCQTYNEMTSDIYKIGERLNDFFENKLKQLNLN